MKIGNYVRGCSTAFMDLYVAKFGLKKPVV